VATAKKRVTIKDVAARAGVSYQTVSRVINNHISVSQSTRKSVEQAIADLNYRPSLAARSLPGRRFYVIGFIIPYDPDYLIRDPHLLAQISGADAEANTQDYNVLLSTAGNSRSGLDAYERFVRHYMADGALVIDTTISATGGELLARQNYPYVSLGYDLGNPTAYMVHSDDRNGARLATQYLLEKGHRRIGIINGPAIGATVALQYRFEGYQEALSEARLSFDPSLMVYGDYTRISGELAAQRLLALSDPPTAIFALNDRMAIGAMRVIQMAGLRVPEDVAVLGFDDIPLSVDCAPALTTVRQPSREIGRVAAELLFKLINGEAVTEREIVLPAELVVRQSA